MNVSRLIEGLGKSVAGALRISDSRRETYRLSFGMLACAYLILVCVSFAMLWLGDKLNASGMALTRFMASGQAPVTAQFAYPAGGRDQIAVFLYDHEFLRETGTSWPMSYQDHADWLLRLTGQPGARPKAIFLDITFGQERNDKSLPALMDALCTIQNSLRIPVFIAALPSPVDGKLEVRPGLDSDRACFTLVGIDYTPDPLDRIAWTYPVSPRHNVDIGAEVPAAVPSVSAHGSAAVTIARNVAKIKLDEPTVPMALVWGHDAVTVAPLAEDFANCVPTRPWNANLVPAVFRQLYESENERPPLCPYHRTLSMSKVIQLPERDLAAHVKDRYLMVGARVPGYNDFVTSPVHGLLPGVYYHAMALDNLLSFRGEYKLAHEWNFRGLMAALLWPGLLAIAIVLLVRQGWDFCGRRLDERWKRCWYRCSSKAGVGVEISRKYPSDWLRIVLLAWITPLISSVARRHAALPNRRLRRRAGELLLSQVVRIESRLAGAIRRNTESWYDRTAMSALGAFAWAGRVALQFLAAVAMIVLLQKLFRVGMLPVAELVSMTLLAEGIGYLGKLRWLVLGRETPCPTCA